MNQPAVAAVAIHQQSKKSFLDINVIDMLSELTTKFVMKRETLVGRGQRSQPELRRVLDERQLTRTQRRHLQNVLRLCAHKSMKDTL